jgi:hypothetical protein
VRVLEYRDTPGDATHPHSHPDSVMVTLSSFERVITANDREVPVQLEAGQVRWLDAQSHQGRNVGQTQTDSVFIELKEPRGSRAGRCPRNVRMRRRWPLQRRRGPGGR